MIVEYHDTMKVEKLYEVTILNKLVKTWNR